MITFGVHESPHGFLGSAALGPPVTRAIGSCISRVSATIQQVIKLNSEAAGVSPDSLGKILRVSLGPLWPYDWNYPDKWSCYI